MTYLSDARRRKTLFTLPEPVDDRLESLTRVARAGRMQVSRSQMIAALIASAPTDPNGLAGVVQRYLDKRAEAFAREHPGADLPDIQHPGAKRGAAHWRKREHGAPSLKRLPAIVDDITPGLTDRYGAGPVSAAQAAVSFSHPGSCHTRPRSPRWAAPARSPPEAAEPYGTG